MVVLSWPLGEKIRECLACSKTIHFAIQYYHCGKHRLLRYTGAGNPCKAVWLGRYRMSRLLHRHRWRI
jgi:hypothetical protein